jgi:Domain of unknown function (DUF4350)
MTTATRGQARTRPATGRWRSQRGTTPMTGVRQQRPWRSWLIVAAIVIAGGTLIAVLHSPPPNSYLNPGSTAGDGTHALADVLTELGHQVVATSSVQSALGSATADSTLVVTSPGYLSQQQLGALGRTPADVVVVEPDAAALAAIAPSVAIVGSNEPVLVTRPQCGLRAAVLAGTASMGGENLIVEGLIGDVQQCYTSVSGPTLVQLAVHGRLVTLLGTGTPMTNAGLARAGNAALAINLLPSHRIVWLTPPVEAQPPSAVTGARSVFDLVPLTAYLVIAQLAVALLLAIAWRARRLGPLVAEPLPVVVRASETVEGHGRLYQSRHARGKAGQVLRTAALDRLIRDAGLPRSADSTAVATALARRSSLSEARITELLYGPAPKTDQALLALARDLDELEHEVSTT